MIRMARIVDLTVTVSVRVFCTTRVVTGGHVFCSRS